MNDLIARCSAAAVILGAACGAIAGCSSNGGTSGGGAPAANGSPETAAPAAAAAIDACALLSPEDVSALLGTTVEGKPTGTDPSLGVSCLWENPANYESVTVDIGSPNTAVNGTLPPPEPGFPEVGTPGPDGTRFLGNGAVEFPAGGRNNLVQVAVLSMSAEQANAAAVELAKKIGPKVPS